MRVGDRANPHSPPALLHATIEECPRRLPSSRKRSSSRFSTISRRSGQLCSWKLCINVYVVHGRPSPQYSTQQRCRSLSRNPYPLTPAQCPAAWIAEAGGPQQLRSSGVWRAGPYIILAGAATAISSSQLLPRPSRRRVLHQECPEEHNCPRDTRIHKWAAHFSTSELLLSMVSSRRSDRRL
jgi:hypothetical protein